MEETERSPAKEGLLSNWHIVCAFLAGIALIILGFAVEAWVPQLIDYINSFRAGYTGPPADAHGGSGQDALSLSVLLLKELGVAALVAGIIGLAIEKQARERDNQRHVKLRHEVANDAVFAIYGVRHGKAFVKAAVETNLSARIVRENLVLKYMLRNLTVEEAKTISPSNHVDAKERFVMVEMHSSYRFRNVASGNEDVPISYVINLLQGSGAQKLTGIHYACIDDEDVTARIDGEKRSQDGTESLHYEWMHKALPPDGTISVIINARCVKGRSDSEVWGSFFPTMGDVKLTLDVLNGMRFGAKSLSNAALVKDHSEPSAVSKSWEMKGPLLRHSCMFVWWRKPEDAAEDVVSAQAEFSRPEPDAAPVAPAKRQGIFRRLLDMLRGKAEEE